ncbi:RNA polymerase sigma factor [Chitinophaga sp. HK235]|uniref:RNA polymerase sigma factor n=1 Tax=Chitinophaga sp. HK235 TaxID=2952571 RepID=UPI001BAB0F32|nr:sigma-70 family RNA polymerase sigma factor [Chitinophaga sp. HK235]
MERNFIAEFKEQTPRLMAFFSKKLKAASYKGNREEAVQQLLQLTSEAAYINSLKESLNDYSTSKLIWLKARNVWSDFMEKISKQAAHAHLDLDSVLLDPSPDPLQKLTIQEDIERIKKEIGEEGWEILTRRLEKTPYKQLAEEYQTSEGAMKVRVYRLRLVAQAILEKRK